jgi:hypothetical protein
LRIYLYGKITKYFPGFRLGSDWASYCYTTVYVKTSDKANGTTSFIMAVIQPSFTGLKWNMGEILPFLA